MTKKVIKELIITLLLCLAIILLLGILLYDYVPMAKTIPSPVSYTTPENVKKELADATTVDESKIILTYEVDATDLSNYARIQDYKPGKANPFSSYEATEIGGTNSTVGNSSNKGTSNNSTSGNNATNTTTNTSSSTQPTTGQNTTNSGGHFFQDKGTK